jgi:cytochrome c oxidase subunit 2
MNPVPQNVLDVAGSEAGVLADLFWIFLVVTAVVWVLVVIVLVIAITRRKTERLDPLMLNAPTERRFGVIVSSLAVLTGIIVITLSVVSFSAQAQLFGQPAAAVTIKVTGHQWWWEVEYEDADPSKTFTTANEIRVPIGEPVTVKLTSSDVIHSFWVPSLFGKMDAITGRENEIRFTAVKPGVYRGQCAEFCGLQHAHMGLIVFVEDRAAFDAWRAAQIAPAIVPASANEQQGREVFLGSPCVTCHAVRGTLAGGRAGPDLTHLASRTSIAAATLPFTRGALAAWIVDPHGTKPGVHMPTTTIEPADLHVLLDYLTSLK